MSTVAPAPPTLDRELVRWDVPLLRDPALQARVRAAGWAQLPPILDADDLGALRALAEEFLARVEGPTGELFLTVGRITDVVLRAEMIDRAGAIVRPKLAPLFVDGAQLLCSAFQVKPPSPRSELNPHQDSSLVDERRWPGTYAWIPLIDTDRSNGGLEVVTGSHRFGNHQRTLSVPWQLAGCEEVLRSWSTPLSVPAGGVVLFDSATVHGSPPNPGSELRIALNNFARPPGAGLRHVYQDERTPPGEVEVYEIEPSFLFSDDIMVRPGPQHRDLGTEPHQVLACTPDLLDRLCAEAATLAVAP